MADGYARATGRPGVALAVCGPGVYNAATPLATAFSDSVPVLLVSGQVPTSARGGPRSGYYHENDQLAACAHFTKGQFALRSPQDIVPTLDAAWAQLTGGRPGPVFLDVPINVSFGPAASGPLPSLSEPPPTPAPRSQDIDALAKLLSAWRRPLLLAGGGVITAGAER